MARTAGFGARQEYPEFGEYSADGDIRSVGKARQTLGGQPLTAMPPRATIGPTIHPYSHRRGLALIRLRQPRPAAGSMLRVPDCLRMRFHVVVFGRDATAF